MRKQLYSFYILILLFGLSYAAYGQSDGIYLKNMIVYDGFTEDILDSAHVSILEADSVTVLADSLEGIWSEGTSNGVTKRFFIGFGGNVPRRDIYIIRITHQGYAPQLVKIEVPQKRYGKPTVSWTLPNVYLWHQMNYDLGEATVKGTQIKMVMRGDTLVYNAAAFQMAEGSMLDNLVRALPGVKLEDGGRITVNGEYVSSLLVNGRDFFKGDPQIALANLPAYTVNKIKVYKKAPRERENQERSEAERKKDPLVMDVNLKREYAQGWIANVEAGGGSRLGDGFDPIWMGRLFALRYTNHSSLGIYANINNMDDYQAPGSKGEWKRTEPGQGRRTTKMGGIDFSVDGKETGIKFNTTLQAMRQDITGEQRTSAEDYLPAAPSVFRSNRSVSRTGTTDLKWSSNLYFPHFPNKRNDLFHISLDPTAYYIHTSGTSTSASSQWQTVQNTGNYVSALDALYNRQLHATTENTNWGGNVKLRAFGYLPWGDIGFNFMTSASYDHRDWASLTGDHIVYDTPSTPNITQLRSDAQPTNKYTFSIDTKMDKSINLTREKNFQVSIKYTYEQTFHSGIRNLSEKEGLPVSENLLVPSVTATNEWLIDQVNSFHTTRLQRTHTLKPQLFSFPLGPVGLSIEMPLTFTERRIHDLRGGNDRLIKRNDFTWQPLIDLTHWGKQLWYEIVYEFRQELPDIFYQLDVRDDSDPLYVSLGNDRLKSSRIHAFHTGFNYKMPEHQRIISMRARYNKSDRLVALARFYDLATGVTTTRPENIDGNWDAALSIAYTQGLGKDDRWTLQGEAKGTFLHSVDFATDNPSATLPDRVAVDNLSIDAMLRADYRFEKWTAGAKATVKHTRLTGGGPAFTPFHYTDATMGITLTAPLPGGIDLETDVMAYLRRGYTDASMNTTDWVWNASLSKAFGKRKQWLLRAVGFDILGQLSNIRRTVNAQGRTETWYNTTPAYASLHLTYRFDMKPKKRAEKR